MAGVALMVGLWVFMLHRISLCWQFRKKLAASTFRNTAFDSGES
jgi:hypothetical protein